LNSYGNIKCPCRLCFNVPWVSLDILKSHISQNGWDPAYTQWREHGEPDPLPIEDNTTQCEMIDMRACLNDILDIPLNNEQNVPTPPNTGETSNEPAQATTPPVRNEYEELLASSTQPLYPGCDFMTTLDFMSKFTHLKVSGKWSDTSFNNTLKFL
jgi:hypothetical protein